MTLADVRPTSDRTIDLAAGENFESCALSLLDIFLVFGRLIKFSSEYRVRTLSVVTRAIDYEPHQEASLFLLLSPFLSFSFSFSLFCCETLGEMRGL